MIFVSAWDNQGKAPPGWGSHLMFLWRDFEPAKGQYDFSRVEKALNAAARPCYLQIGISMYDKTLKRPVDYTPKAHKRSLALAAPSGITGETPDYSPAWTAAYNAAVTALSERFRDHPHVAGYWCACGWNQETQAAVDNGGGPWAKLLKPLLAEATYLDFITASVTAARHAWAPKPVYVPGLPSPGALWGHRRRDIIANLLRDGAGYMNCGLTPDIAGAVGLGAHTNMQAYDIVVGRTARVGFEEGPRAAPADAGELYWMALKALHWGADFLCVYMSLSGPQVADVTPFLPDARRRWIVFRDAEYPATTYTGADGKVYGHSGEPGCWGAGLRWAGAGKLTFDKTRYDWGRWRLDADAPLTLAAPGLADGVYRALLYRPDGAGDVLNVAVKAERLELPAGAYHRVDLFEPALEPERPDPLPTDEAQPTLTALRWWLEEEARQREAGNPARADAILYANIELAYRLEGVTR